MSFSLRPTVGSAERFNGLVEMSVRKIPLAFSILNHTHIDHSRRKKEKAHRCFSFVGVDEMCLKTEITLDGIEEFTHGPVPFENPEDSGQMVTFHEFL